MPRKASLREKHLLRELIKAATGAIDQGYGFSVGLEEFVDKVEQEVFKVTQDRVAHVPARPGRVVARQYGVGELALQIFQAHHDDHLEGAVAGAAPGERAPAVAGEHIAAKAARAAAGVRAARRPANLASSGPKGAHWTAPAAVG